MEYWDYAAVRAAASRERAKALRAMSARVTAWLRGAPTTIRVPQARERECSGTAY